MYYGSIYHDDIIRAFKNNVPDCYVRDYRDQNGYIVICRGYRDIPWRDQTTTRKVYRKIPHITLANLPRGYVTSATHFKGLRLHRPGWRLEFKDRAMRHLTEEQMRGITAELGVGEIFPGIVVHPEDDEEE